ncbi:Cof-type HAD-IIB family hydrolase [Bacillaceae bacterium Marseille-Q3522]|nr:Cof-type HAD-IIB family hydrolase [Bacillaceae bacterium Marseille-Q3522]
MIKGIVFFDLDGTLLNSFGRVSEDVILSIKKLINNHYMPVLATGRSLFEVRELMNKTEITSMVGMNGQIVIWNNKVIFNKTINKEVVDKITIFSNKKNVGISYYNDKRNAISLKNELILQTYHNISSPVPPIDRYMYKNEPINMMLIATDVFDEEYQKTFPELSFVRNSPYCMDVFSKGNNKARAIEKLIKFLSMNNLPIYAFGDGSNDIEMFKLADYSIAMENGVEKLKRIATHVTGSNDNAGITDGLKYFKLID